MYPSKRTCGGLFIGYSADPGALLLMSWRLECAWRLLAQTGTALQVFWVFFAGP
jgi:hypothetical protein